VLAQTDVQKNNMKNHKDGKSKLRENKCKSKVITDNSPKLHVVT